MSEQILQSAGLSSEAEEYDGKFCAWFRASGILLFGLLGYYASGFWDITLRAFGILRFGLMGYYASGFWDITRKSPEERSFQYIL